MRLEVVQHHVGTAAEGIPVVRNFTVGSGHLGGAVYVGLTLRERVPFAHGYGRIVVVGAYEYEYRVHALSQLGLHPFGLGNDLMHLVAAHSVHIGLEAEEVGKVVPVDVVAPAYLTLVGDRIAQERDPAAGPLVFGEGLGRKARCEGYKRRCEREHPGKERYALSHNGHCLQPQQI